MRREPALIIGVVSALLSLVAAFGVGGLTNEQVALTVAAITAIGGAWTAALTRPVAPSAFTAAVTAGADLVAAFGLNFTAEQIGAVNALVLAVLVLLTRVQVSPAKS